MSQLHACFNLRNQQAFERLLESGHERGQPTSKANLSSSGGKSWNRPSPLTSATFCTVNARDRLGRTVLHLACAATDRASIDYVRLLLQHPCTDVNLADTESQWTALHRALYNGNISVALLLLQRQDTDTSLKDSEGYTAYDLYNSTVQGTTPSLSKDARVELFMWGANRNAALGVGDGNDRVFPDHVAVPFKDVPGQEGRHQNDLIPINVRQVSMSPLHTVVTTAEARGNLRLCGFGSGGRLGSGQHTQYTLKPLHEFTHSIVSVALGQDHTLALTEAGEVLTWGLNRFSQLGYVIEPNPHNAAAFGRFDDTVQPVPRKIYGSLRKGVVKGVAACKIASACWTARDVYTWGTNNGQLGYDKVAQPVQVLPRIVTIVTHPVISISMTDSVMACLLQTQDVICIYNDHHFKINFPVHQIFREGTYVHRPPGIAKDAIVKITSCDETFAALFSNGELFTFTPPYSEGDASSTKEKMVVKPQRVWALRKQFSAARDVALGSDGSIIICTDSGHVFVRSRNAKAGASKGFKFQRVPFIQRVKQVCANSTGAYGALRVDFSPASIELRGNTLVEDLGEIQPYLRFKCDHASCSKTLPCNLAVRPSRERMSLSQDIGFDEETDDMYIQRDVEAVSHLIDFLNLEYESQRDGGLGYFEEATHLPHGADLFIQVQPSVLIPTHRALLAARCSVLLALLSGSMSGKTHGSQISLRLVARPPGSTSPARLTINGCHPLSVLLLLVYFYTDDIPAIWDLREAAILHKQLTKLKVKPNQVKRDLENLARDLQLPLLMQVLEVNTKRTPKSSLLRDMDRLYNIAQEPSGCVSTKHRHPLLPDIKLQFADKDVFCHSFLLRSRSIFFANFFAEDIWTLNRRNADGIIQVDMRHSKWNAMQYVLRFVCCGGDEDMFASYDAATSVDELIEFMFEVVAASSELLLNRLILICSSVILKHLSVNNACYILGEATHFHCLDLVKSVQGYMVANMETLLESGMLNDLQPDLVNQLDKFVLLKQSKQRSRSAAFVERVMKESSGWLALQDFAKPIIRTTRAAAQKSPQTSTTTGRKSRRSINSPPVSPTLRAQPLSRQHTNEEVFVMDEPDAIPSVSLKHDQPPTSSQEKPYPVWKPGSATRVDMRALMAEAEHTRAAEKGGTPETHSHSPSSSHNQANFSLNFNQRAPQRERRKAPLKVSETVGTAPPSTSRTVSSPWRLQSTPTSTSAASKDSPFASLPASAAHAPDTPTPTRRNISSSADLPRSSSSAQGMSTLGPVYTPQRPLSKVESSSTGRSSNNVKVWRTSSQATADLPTTAASGISLIAIQQLQLEQEQDVAKSRDPRSLLEIQEEEKARRAEEDFLRWWATEEARVQLEVQKEASPRRPGRSPRKTKMKKTQNTSATPHALPS